MIQIAYLLIIITSCIVGSKDFPDQSLTSSLQSRDYPRKELAGACNNWAIYARSRTRSAEDDFTWFMPLDLLFRSSPNHFSSFHVLLPACEIGIFKRPQVIKADAKIVRIAFAIRADYVDFAIVKFTEILLSLATFDGEPKAIGMSIKFNQDSALSNNSLPMFRFQLYFARPSNDSNLVVLFKMIYTACTERMEGNCHQEVDLIDMFRLGDAPSSVKQNTDHIDLFMQQRMSKEEILTRINGPGGLIAVEMFLYSLQSRENRLVLRRTMKFSKEKHLFRMENIDKMYVHELCQFNLYEKADGIDALGFHISELSIEMTINDKPFTISATVHFENLNNEIDIQLDLFKWIQNAKLSLLEFSHRFISSSEKSPSDDERKGHNISEVHISLFGAFKEQVGNFNFNSPTIIIDLSNWAFKDPNAILMLQKRENKAMLDKYVDEWGSFMSPSDNTLLISVGLPNPITVDKECLSILIFSMLKLFGTKEYANFILFGYILSTRIIRMFSKSLKEIDVQVEWIILIKQNNFLKDKNAVLNVLKELTDAFVLHLASHGFYRRAKKGIEKHGIKLTRLFENGPFPDLFENSKHFVNPSDMPFPKFTIMKSIIQTVGSKKTLIKGKDANATYGKEEHLIEFDSKKKATVQGPSQILTINITECNTNDGEKIRKSSFDILNDKIYDLDCFMCSSNQSNLFCFLTSLVALQKFVLPESTKQVVQDKGSLGSFGFLNALMAPIKKNLSKDLIIADTGRFLDFNSEHLKSDNILEFSIILDQKDRLNVNIISQIIEELVYLTCHGVLAIHILIGESGLTKLRILAEKDGMSKYLARIRTWGKVKIDESYDSSRWSFVKPNSFRTIDSWSHYILMKNQCNPIKLMQWNNPVSLKAFENWIKSQFDSKLLANRDFQSVFLKIDRVIWINNESTLSITKPSTVSIHRFQINGQAHVIDKILHHCFRELQNKKWSLLGRSLDENDSIPTGLVASNFVQGKFSSLDFILGNGENLDDSNRMKIREWILLSWKSILFTEKWMKLNAVSAAKGDQQFLFLFGIPPKQKKIHISPFSEEQHEIFEKTLVDYFNPVMEPNHEFVLFLDLKFYEKKSKSQIFQNSEDTNKLCIKWEGIRTSFKFGKDEIIEDELFLLRRILTKSLQCICVSQRFWARKYIRAIKIITLQSNEYLMTWEINKKIVSEKIEKSLRQCMLDFLEMCGASPTSKNQALAFKQYIGGSGCTVRKWSRLGNLNDPMLELDADTKVAVQLLHYPIFAKENDNNTQRHDETLNSYSDDLRLELKLPETLKTAKIEKHSYLQKMMVYDLEKIIESFCSEQKICSKVWSFALTNDLMKNQQKNSEIPAKRLNFTKIMYKRRPLLVSTGKELLFWTLKLWRMTDDEYFRTKETFIAFMPLIRPIEKDLSLSMISHKTEASNGLLLWQRTLLLILSNTIHIGHYIDRVEMFRDKFHMSIMVSFFPAKDFIGKEVIEEYLETLDK